MIVQCDKCGSRFDVDEGILQPSGRKLKCSRCKNIFFQPPPEGGEEEADDLLAAMEGGAAPPAPTADAEPELEADLESDPEPEVMAEAEEASGDEAAPEGALDAELDLDLDDDLLDASMMEDDALEEPDGAAADDAEGEPSLESLLDQMEPLAGDEFEEADIATALSELAGEDLEDDLAGDPLAADAGGEDPQEEKEGAGEEGAFEESTSLEEAALQEIDLDDDLLAEEPTTQADLPDDPDAFAGLDDDDPGMDGLTDLNEEIADLDELPGLDELDMDGAEELTGVEEIDLDDETTTGFGAETAPAPEPEEADLAGLALDGDLEDEDAPTQLAAPGGAAFEPEPDPGPPEIPAEALETGGLDEPTPAGEDDDDQDVERKPGFALPAILGEPAVKKILWAVFGFLGLTWVLGSAIQGDWFSGPQWGGGGLKLENAAGAWASTIEGSSLLMVEGTLNNDARSDRKARLVKVTLLDERGQEVGMTRVIPGMLLSEEDLTLSDQGLRRMIQIQSDPEGLPPNYRIRPSRSVKFQALFINPAPEATGYRIDLEEEMVSPEGERRVGARTFGGTF